MSPFAQAGKNRNLRYFFGGVLCCLLVLFAVAAKLALYHPQKAAQPIAATKAWQDNAIPSTDTETVSIAPSLLQLFTIMLGLVFAIVWHVSFAEPTRPAPSWYSAHLFVRPPPTC